jgi:hypothetical protein
MNDNQLINLNGSTISHGKYFLEVFKRPLFEYMLKNILETMKIIDKFVYEHTDIIFIIIQELLTFAKENKIKESEMLADVVIDRCNYFERGINGIIHRKINFLNINRIVVSLKNKPSEAIKKNGSYNALYSWILEELFTSNDLEKKSMFLQHFLICLVDQESTKINQELLIVFRQLRDEDTSVWLKKLESDEILRSQATSCFQMLLKMLVVTKSLTLYQGIIKYVAGTYDCLFKKNIKEYISSYFANIPDINAIKSLQIAYKIFMDFNSRDERIDVLKYFLLPSIESSKTCIIEKFYEEHCEEMILYTTKKIDDILINTADRIKLIISKIGSYNIFELLFAKFELKFIMIKDPVTEIEKSVNQILVRQAMDLRSLIAKNDEEKEITRLLHCAGFNCCAMLISMKKEEEFYPFIFFEDRKMNKLIWERIVDCERKYYFLETTASVKKNRKILINIRRRDYNDDLNLNETAELYFHPYNLASLTFLENVHAYDLNDIRILTQTENSVEPERRLNLSFESDELNDHECMPMISGVLVHMFNSEICIMPEGPVGIDQLPQCLKYFRNSFSTQRDNVRLFLMKIIGNAKNAFLPCIKAFFKPLLGTVYRYLANNPLNYIVRDILVIFIQSKYTPCDEDEIKDAQELMERLIHVTPDSSVRVFHYNLEIIESLGRLWKERLLWPKVLEHKLNEDHDLVVGASLALLRVGLRGIVNSKPTCDCIWAAMQTWTDEESKVLARFEVFGWILRLSDEQSRCIRLLELKTLLSNLVTKNRERWARCLFALHRGWGTDAYLESVFCLVEPGRLPEHVWPEALNFFLKRLPHLQHDRLHAELACLNLAMYLRERSIACAGLALRILAALVPRLTEIELRPLLLLTMRLTGSAGTAEQRRLGYTVLAEAHLHYRNGHYLQPLVRGLDDPLEEVREPVLEFWHKRISMPWTSGDRLLAILELYAPELSTVFTRFLCLLMLDLTTKAPSGEQSFLDRPLTFNDVDLPSWRFTSLGTYAPLFVPSLASRLNVPGTWMNVARSTPKRMPDPSQNELSWRPNRMNHTPRIETTSGQQQSSDDRRITYNAKSDISQKSFVECVRRLVTHDWLFCKDFAVALVCQLIERLRGSETYDNFINNLTANFDKAFQAQQSEGDMFLAAVLEIVLHSNIMNVSAQTVGKVCRTPRLHTLGVVFLEQNMLKKEKETLHPPKKKAKTDDLEKNNWMELATLYKLMRKEDLLKSIFKRSNIFSKEIRNGVLAQLNNKWLEAKNYYETVYEVSFSPEKEFCLEGMFECFCELGYWGEINKKTDIILDGKYETIWEAPKQQFLLPWIFRGQLQKYLDALNDGKELTNAKFLTNFDNWIQAKESIMKKLYGEELAMFYICGQETDEIPRHSIKCHLDYLREQWICSNPLFENVRTQILLKLRAIYNISSYIETIKSTDIVEASKNIIRYWDEHMPSSNDNLLIWNIHISYRLTLANILYRKISEIEKDST